MTPALRWYFRKRFFLGKDRIPTTGPMLILANHSASFLDAILMGVMMDRPIHFYVRGDIFNKPLARWIFTQLHMIPVFSADLAKQDLFRNTESFDIGSNILCKGGVLLIFPEGLSRQERNLMPFRKSPVRVILQALQKDMSLNVSVVPIGINFTKHAFQSDLQLVTGEVIWVSAQSIAHALGEDETVAIRSSRALPLLTKQMRDVFEPMVLYVSNENRYALLDKALNRLEYDDEGMSYEKFARQRECCNRIDALTDEQAVALDKELSRAVEPKRHWSTSMLLVLSFPLFVLGMVLNYIPYAFGKYMADTNVTRQDFYTSVQLAASAVSYVLWLLSGLIVWIIIRNDVWLYAILAAPFLGQFAFWWKRKIAEYTQ